MVVDRTSTSSAPLVFLAVPLMRVFGELVASADVHRRRLLDRCSSRPGMWATSRGPADLPPRRRVDDRVWSSASSTSCWPGTLAAVGAILAIVLEAYRARDTGVATGLELHVGFVHVGQPSASLLAFATVWYRATLHRAAPRRRWRWNTNAPNNCSPTSCPASIAARLKDPAHDDDRRPLRRRLDPVRRYRRLHRTFQRTSNPATWWRSSIGSTPSSTCWWTVTGWRRSRPPATRTWWSAGYLSRAPIICRRHRIAGTGHGRCDLPNP